MSHFSGAQGVAVTPLSALSAAWISLSGNRSLSLGVYDKCPVPGPVLHAGSLRRALQARSQEAPRGAPLPANPASAAKARYH